MYISMRAFFQYWQLLTDLNLRSNTGKSQMINYESISQDESLDPIIQQLLPDIEESIKKQLMSQLQEQAQAEFQKQLMKIQAQALQQYESAMSDLEEEGEKLLKQQTQQLKKQLDKLKRQKKIKEETHTKHLQDKYISENFQQVILNHPKMKQIQNILAIQILESSEQKIQSTKQRRMKQIIVRMQNRQQKYLKQKDKAIKNQIYQSKSIDDLKKDIQLMKIGLASMKSQYNVKIKKIDNQIKQIRQRNANLKPKENINQLKKQYQLLKDKQQQINERILNPNNYVTSNQNFDKQKYEPNKNNSTFSHLDCSSQYETMQPPTINRTSQPTLRRQTVQQQQYYSESQSQQYSQQNMANEDLVRPPIYHASADVSQQNMQTFEAHVPILKLNVASLLRTNWDDPLHKYVNQSQSQSFNTQFNSLQQHIYDNNQNDAKIGNKSSFQQIYHQHLDKLNQNSKRKKLSEQAKKAISRNLSMMNKMRT